MAIADDIAWKSPKAEDNPYRVDNNWNTSEEWKSFSLWYPYSLRVLSTFNQHWSEVGRFDERETAYHIGAMLSASQGEKLYILVQCVRRGKDGREKPVAFFPNRQLVEKALKTTVSVEEYWKE